MYTKLTGTTQNKGRTQKGQGEHSKNKGIAERTYGSKNKGKHMENIVNTEETQV